MSDKTTDVFISYKREDQTKVERLAVLLDQLGVSAWYDVSLSAGEDWWSRLQAKAREAKAVLFCWTPLADASEWVRREVEIGLERKVLVPVRFAPGSPPAHIDALHAPDLSDWDGSSHHPGLRQLIEGLQAKVEKPLLRSLENRQMGYTPAALAALRARLVAVARTKSDTLDFFYALKVVLQTFPKGQPMSPIVFVHACRALSDQNRQRREPPLGILIVSEDDPDGTVFFANEGLLPRTSPLAPALRAELLAQVRAFDWPDP